MPTPYTAMHCNGMHRVRNALCAFVREALAIVLPKGALVPPDPLGHPGGRPLHVLPAPSLPALPLLACAAPRCERHMTPDTRCLPRALQKAKLWPDMRQGRL
jgi:hypothetical protein